MSFQKKNELIASSSVWVSMLLNILPGLGTGYLYQRRWKPYWLTVFITTIWITVIQSLSFNLDPTDPAPLSYDKINLYGLILISFITSFESFIAIKKARSIATE